MSGRVVKRKRLIRRSDDGPRRAETLERTHTMVEIHTIHRDENAEYTDPNYLDVVFRQAPPKEDYAVRETLNVEKLTLSAFPRCPGEPEGAGHASLTFTDANGESVNITLNREAIEFLARQILEA
jgi:hypothetical protein